MSNDDTEVISQREQADRLFPAGPKLAAPVGPEPVEGVASGNEVDAPDAQGAAPATAAVGEAMSAPACVVQPTLFDDIEMKPETAEAGTIEEDALEPLFPFAVLADWSVVLLCVGLALVCACVIIPQADANRRLVYEREKLQRDLTQIQNQHEVNQEFLRRIEDDPQLAERLAMRQMKMVPRGMSTLDLNALSGSTDHTAILAADSAQQVSPFVIVNVPPPPALPPYRPLGGVLAAICLKPQASLLVMAAAIMMIAIGLVLGPGSKPAATAESTD